MGRFTSEHLEPYDCRRFEAFAYSAVGAPSDRIMALGGWSNWDMVKLHYLAGSLVATPAMVDFYGWLARPAVAVKSPPLASFVPAMPPPAVPPAVPSKPLGRKCKRGQC